MASVTITLNNVCPGGGHGTLTVTGAMNESYNVDVEEIRSALDDETKRDFIMKLVRVHAIGKTKAQLRASLLAGLSVSIGE